MGKIKNSNRRGVTYANTIIDYGVVAANSKFQAMNARGQGKFLSNLFENNRRTPNEGATF